ncbi:hypothetical protein F4703DRAFT_1797873 [Phycomyces blakesleeanus]
MLIVFIEAEFCLKTSSSALAFLEIQIFMLFGFIGISGTRSLGLARHSSLQQTNRLIYRHNFSLKFQVQKNCKIDKWDCKKKLAAKKLLEGQVSNPSENVKPAKKTKVISTWTFDEDYYVLDDLPHIN